MKKSPIKDLVKALNEDKDYYNVWQANIAMFCYDELTRKKDNYKNKTTIHMSCNKAAENFLRMLTSIK